MFFYVVNGFSCKKGALQGRLRTMIQTKIRLLLLDIDGTLVSTNDKVSSASRRAVQAAYEAGCAIALCTGRTRFRIHQIAEQLGNLPEFAVTANGAVLSHLKSKSILYRRQIPADTALDVVRTIRNSGVEPFVYEDSDREGVEGARVLYHPDALVNAWVEQDPRYRPFHSILEEIPFPPVSISVYGNPTLVRPAAKTLRLKLSDTVSVLESGTEHEWGVEFYSVGVNKRLGAETMAKYLDIAPEETMAIGDHLNDLEMLEWAGIGVAMGNAQPEVHKIANWTTSSLQQEGVAKAIERFIAGQQAWDMEEVA